METIKHLIAENPSGLLEMKSPLFIPEYRDNYGFGLKNISTIYQSKKIHHSGKDWFASKRTNSLNQLFTVQEESTSDLLVVYIIETIKQGRVYCHLVLTDEVFRKILDDKTQHILQVHQMYSKFWKDYIVMNKKMNYPEWAEKGRVMIP